MRICMLNSENPRELEDTGEGSRRGVEARLVG